MVKYLPRYKILVCKACYEGNWDGWNDAYEKILKEPLEKKGLPIPERNKNNLHPSRLEVLLNK
jgi:hypothetical protein